MRRMPFQSNNLNELNSGIRVESMPLRATSVGIVDDHPMMIEGINAFLSRRENYVVVDRGETVRDLLRIAGEKRVDVLICELSMAGDVYGAIAEIRERHPQTLVIIYTGSPSTELAVGALDAGAKGFVLKGSPIEELEDALEAVCAGSVYISPRFAPRVITALQAARIEREEARLTRLSVREEQIVKLLLCGRQNREIALTLGLSERTVKGYMTNLMSKLGARNRLEVVIAAQKTQPPATAPRQQQFEVLSA